MNEKVHGEYVVEGLVELLCKFQINWSITAWFIALRTLSAHTWGKLLYAFMLPKTSFLLHVVLVGNSVRYTRGMTASHLKICFLWPRSFFPQALQSRINISWLCLQLLVKLSVRVFELHNFLLFSPFLRFFLNHLLLEPKPDLLFEPSQCCSAGKIKIVKFPIPKLPSGVRFWLRLEKYFVIHLRQGTGSEFASRRQRAFAILSWTIINDIDYRASDK